ncbi:helix-turn-helix transcriptional regulator [Massilibacteroides sp.]|uniref:helix-turn-helix transcriptional regulator n=1 Tax=Massilibacteroides sp. TaxID=2034766 RepID=UPI002616E719|nr:helix-turn-helix transcriptional regulator [Massilibacteroides sp.]MDD4515584.1 helix-turn-helix transcriptional regulator [Massilibacteroides sp.]
MEDDIQLCECYGTVDLAVEGFQLKEKKYAGDLSQALKANSMIEIYINGLYCTIMEGLDGEDYLDIKTKELLYLLSAFYEKEELISFFSTALYTNTAFPAYILRYHHLYNSVAELAEAMNYTVSGFEKRFKKIFGIPPSKWLREQKARRIYREVCLGRKNFKEIADKYNFSSTSTFNDFFKLAFGETPGVVRKKNFI